MGDVGTSPNLGKSATEEVRDGAPHPTSHTNLEEADKGSFNPTRVEGLPDVHKRTKSVCLPAETKGIDEAVNHCVSAPPKTTLSFIETLRDVRRNAGADEALKNLEGGVVLGLHV